MMLFLYTWEERDIFPFTQPPPFEPHEDLSSIYPEELYKCPKILKEKKIY